MENLLEKKCIPCSIGDIPLSPDEIDEYLGNLQNGWKVIEGKKIEKIYKFKDFKEALDFTNKVGSLAETEGHHPDFYLAWGKVIVYLWTHKINGLHENDFIMAAKIDKITG